MGRLSAKRYIDFAEHAAGLSGYIFIHSRIHAALELDVCCKGDPFSAEVSDLSEAIDDMRSVGGILVSNVDNRKDDESGAKTTLSVYN